ncbi:hypothetical protein ACH5RR_025986, partial [Cinchona calisaya]
TSTTAIARLHSSKGFTLTATGKNVANASPLQVEINDQRKDTIAATFNHRMEENQVGFVVSPGRATLSAIDSVVVQENAIDVSTAGKIDYNYGATQGEKWAAVVHATTNIAAAAPNRAMGVASAPYPSSAISTQKEKTATALDLKINAAATRDPSMGNFEAISHALDIAAAQEDVVDVAATHELDIEVATLYVCAIGTAQEEEFVA